LAKKAGSTGLAKLLDSTWLSTHRCH